MERVLRFNRMDVQIFIIEIQVDWCVRIREVHEAICPRMIDLQSIIIIYFIILVFVASMGRDSEDKLRGQILRDLNFESTLPNIRGF